MENNEFVGSQKEYPNSQSVARATADLLGIGVFPQKIASPENRHGKHASRLVVAETWATNSVMSPPKAERSYSYPRPDTSPPQGEYSHTFGVSAPRG